MTSILFAGDYLPRRAVDCPRLWPGSMVIANLECAISDHSGDSGKAYSLVLGKRTVDFLRRSGFAALCVANNHALDAGEAAFAEMMRVLEDSCDTRFYGLKDQPFAEVTAGKLRCAIIGCLEKCRARGGMISREEDVDGLIRSLRGDFDRVFVTPHWGKEGEYASHPSPRQRNLARRWIEAGADGVLGHHPHTVHGVEWVDGQPVYYSLGNLLFDHEEGRKYPLTRVGLAVEWSPSPAPGGDRYRHHFFRTYEGLLEDFDDERLVVVEEYFEQIGMDLTDTEKPWTALRWAKAVGPVYIRKSFASWQHRFQNAASLMTAALFALWSLLPCTLLLEWGWWNPNRRLERRRLSFERSVLETARPTELP